MARLTGGKEDIDFDAGLPEDDDVNDEDEGQLEEEYEGQVEEDSTVDASEEEMDDDAAADVEEEYESGGALAVVDGLDVQQRAVTAAPDFSGLYCTCGSSIGS